MLLPEIIGLALHKFLHRLENIARRTQITLFSTCCPQVVQVAISSCYRTRPNTVYAVVLELHWPLDRVLICGIEYMKNCRGLIYLQVIKNYPPLAYYTQAHLMRYLRSRTSARSSYAAVSLMNSTKRIISQMQTPYLTINFLSTNMQRMPIDQHYSLIIKESRSG